MTKVLKIYLPIRIRLAAKVTGKVYPLNLNFWKSRFQIASMKIRFSEIVKDKIKNDPEFWRLAFRNPKIKYVLFYDSLRRTDLMNWVSVIDKFACDALVEDFVMQDDSIEFLQAIDVRFGGLTKENPRVEMTITENEDEIIPIEWEK